MHNGKLLPLKSHIVSLSTTPVSTITPLYWLNYYLQPTYLRPFARFKKTSNSKNWMRRHMKDQYVKQASKDNYRCRSAYKLIQMDNAYHFLQPGNIVIDCGAAPGSWCQVTANRVNSNGADTAKPRGKVIGIDLLHIEPINGVDLLPFCNFADKDTQNRIKVLLCGEKANVIISDMAPNAVGIKSFNHDYIIGLCFSVLYFSLHHLQEGGTFLCKLWMGSELNRLKVAVEQVFHKVQFVKPESSRAGSAEIFCLAKGFKGIHGKS